ncbi:MAG: glycosyltransferase family 87 protein [Sphingomonadaceae bacterium]
MSSLIWTQSRAVGAFRWLLVAITLAFAILSLETPLRSLEEPFVYRKDLVQEYILAKAILAGDNPYLLSAHIRELAGRYVPGYSDPWDPGLPTYHPTAHPPTTGMLFLPISILSYPQSALAWLLLEVVGLVISLYLLARASGLRLPIAAALILAAAALDWYPAPFELALGQLTLAQLPFLAGAIASIRSRRPALAGALAGVAILIKPFPWPVLLVFLLKREWKTLLAAGAVLLLGWGAATALIGIDSVVTYFTQAIPFIDEGYRAQIWNISLRTWGWKLFAGTGSTMSLGDSAPPLVPLLPAAQPISVALPVAALLLGCYFTWRLPSTAWAFGLMICIGILASPIAWAFYLFLAPIPVAQVVEWLARHRFPAGETNAALVVAILLLLPPEAWAFLLTPTLGPLLPPSMGDPAPFVQVIAHLGPAVALAALAALVVALGLRDRR